MAKSLRSKARRKVRAEKRIVNAKKELVKLREVAAKLHGCSKEEIEAQVPDVIVHDDVMAVDQDEERVASTKGQAVRIDNRWMNQRKIKQIKQKIKSHNKKKARSSRGGRKR